MRPASVRPRASLVAAAVFALSACSGPTRVATLNETTQISGAAAATAVQEQLAKQGFPNATVHCAKTIIVNVGPAVSCALSGAGAHGTVRFTFRTLDGKINRGSLKVS
jgi:hypothetical protein